MSAISDAIKAVKEGKIIEKKTCPICGSQLKFILFGLPTEETEQFVEDNPNYFTLGGCMCFCDDRDPTYICPKCGAEFSIDIEQIKLIPCPLEASHAIHEDECRNYELLESKDHYELLKNRELICNEICPIIGKRVKVTTTDGSVIEGQYNGTYIYTYSRPENHLTLSNKRDEYHLDYTDINISEIVSIEEV